ncbi:MAG TPA: lipid-binding SYLF domain-containing protein [Geobacteraceae bacterium]|nr:lipid-binding SYLF domain-containing protein [Geobacteraceae bacterium]
MWWRRLVSLLVMMALLCGGTIGAAVATEEDERVTAAADVFREFVAIPEKGIPSALLRNAYAIAIVPAVVKLGFVVGGRYGKGVMAVRADRGEWSNPSFVTFEGGGVGWQAGAQSSDIILVFKSKRSIEGITRGKFTLGVAAAAAAGPVGRNAEAATDLTLKGEIYSYARSRGLFAGVSLEGAALRIDGTANAAFYGRKGIGADEVLAGKRHESITVRRLLTLLEAHTSPPKK